MKKILFILLLFFSFMAFSQPVVPRSNGSITIQDFRAYPKINFIIPTYLDTNDANSVTALGLNLAGALIYAQAQAKFFIRKGVGGTTGIYWQEVGSGGGSTYTAGNAMTLTGTAFDWGGSMTASAVISGHGTRSTTFDSTNRFRVNRSNVVRLDISNLLTGIYSTSGLSAVVLSGGSLVDILGANVDIRADSVRSFSDLGITTGSVWVVANDYVRLEPKLGRFRIDTLNHSLVATGKMMTWDSASGLVETRAIPTFSTPTLQQVITAGATMTGDNTIVNGSNRLSFSNDGVGANIGVSVGSTSGLTSGKLFYVFDASASTTVNNAELIEANFAGSGVSGTTTAGVFRNNNNSTGTNVAGLFVATTGVTNYAGRFTRGRVSFGTAGTESALLEFNGSSSGTITLQPAAAAGTYTLTLPTTDGAANEFLQTDGNGVLTWAAASATVTWNGISNPTGDQALTYDAGESSTWTNSNTTEDLFTVNTSTITTSSLFSLNSTSTALASGNNLMELVMSGANGTPSITATAARISVTNTGTTNTNIGLDVTASGGSTDNWAIAAAGNLRVTSVNTTQATTSSAFTTITNSLTTGTGHYLASSSLTSGKMIDIAVTGTAALTNQTGVAISLSGANGTGAQTTYGLDVSNTHTGTSTNVAARFTATGGSNNTAAIFAGRIGSGGTTAPLSDIDNGAGSFATGSIIVTSAAGTAANGNFSTSGTTTVGTNTGSIYQILSSTNMDGKVYIGGTGATTIGAGRPYGSLVIGAATAPEAGSGVHPMISSLVIRAPSITTGVATVTNTATLFIESEPTATVTGANYALLINSGNVNFVNGNLTLGTAGNKITVTEGSNGRLGQTALTAGTVAITISGVTTSSRAFVQLVTPSGVTLTTTYQAVCTANTVTIQANVAAGTINTADASTLNYFVFN